MLHLQIMKRLKEIRESNPDAIPDARIPKPYHCFRELPYLTAQGRYKKFNRAKTHVTFAIGYRVFEYDEDDTEPWHEYLSDIAIDLSDNFFANSTLHFAYIKSI